MKQSRRSNGRYSYNPINLLNWRIWVLVATIVFCLLMSHYGNKDDTYIAEPEVSVFMTATVVDHPEDESIETKIRKHFPRSYKTMIAIAKAESGLNNNAKNWNCWYDKDGKISTTYIKGGGRSCKIEDRKYAFGIDCFVLQAHYMGRKDCPANVSLDQHLQEMAKLSKSRSFQPWVVYNTGAYLNHLANK